MRQAVDAYHDLLGGTTGEQLAADTQGALDEQLARRGLVFGERALCTVLRPRFYAPAQFRLLGDRVKPLMRAFDQAFRAAMEDASLRAQFRLAEWEEALLDIDSGFDAPSPTSRLDLFVMDPQRLDDPGSMALTEYNAEVPAGAAYADALGDAFLDLPAMRELARTWRVWPIRSHNGVIHVLLDAWRQFSGGTAKPRIAILDWPSVPTYSEFVLYRDHFTALGIESVISDPRLAEYRDGKLWCEGQPVDLVYKRVLLSELVEEMGLDNPVLRAVRDRAVCMVNSPRSKILHKKASLAVLSDERNRRLLDADAAAAVDAFIPWTRVVEERRTTHGGRDVDLVEFIRRERERLVLKPNDDYGGAGIVLGWTVDAAEWEGALARALAEPYIVQERVPIPSEPYPSLAGGRVHIIDRMIDTAPFVSYGAHADGLLTRLSTAALLNVTAGGGSQVPAFVVEPR
ncbi:Circularly permuted ATP-grasp type 2 [Gemmatirosa kalamazoonensis]|uniref:Circularly permuted ATP-grasp type 2 n=1 Tax=Gemmatirosa kalamazoonensis TaxID=861299 RepID=W0RF03_9BACT|nr:hypothetical protein [Gemmatirosa kalamazoonensis]AHG87958.1 Circularly permuted ATP-grasp type 2 [Gemmatirosa kalamazoonensis]